MTVKSYSIRLLLLTLFLFYAVSPISYTHAKENTSKNIYRPGETPSFSKRFCIYFWELIYSQLVSPEDTSHAESMVRILLKKKRAIIPKNISPQLERIENVSLPENFSLLPII